MLKNNYKSKYISYVNSLSINENQKLILTNDSFINNNPDFYLFYPALFSTYFNISEKNINLLCIAGYLYYQATLFLDKIIDENNLNLLFTSMICQEESIKILSSIYELKSDFWQIWNQRKMEYQRAILLEKNANKDLSFELYSEIAILKASFGKCAIDCVFEKDYNRNESIYKILLQTHDNFSIAYQLNDDILDFEQDYKNKQFNWCLKTFDGKYFKEYSITDCKKIFYIEGYATNIFRLGILELDKAIKLLIDNNLIATLWFSHLTSMKLKFENSIKEIDIYLLQVELSNTKK